MQYRLRLGEAIKSHFSVDSMPERSDRHLLALPIILGNTLNQYSNPFS